MKNKPVHDNQWPSAVKALLLVLLLIFIRLPMPSPVESAVTIVYFRGHGLDGAIELEWATGTEFSTAGFVVQRSSSSQGPFESLENVGFIPARGDGVVGAEYSAIDDSSIENGSTYWYLLVEIELDDSENSEGPISVTAGLAAPTSTPTPTSTPLTIATASQSQATSTVTPGASVTPRPTIGSPTAEGRTSTLTTNPYPEPDTSNANSQPEELADSNFGQVFAQEGTPDNGYPGPQEESIIQPPVTTPDAADGYPAPVILPPIDDAYPQPQLQPSASSQQDSNNLSPGENNQPIESIGSGSNFQNDAGADEQQMATSIFLWLGFIVALLIFLAGVYGSIIIFTRQNRSGN